ncbi:MAG: hypothetical protein ACYCW6_23260 [Candidatus Xenobia bacterium]
MKTAPPLSLIIVTILLGSMFTGYYVYLHNVNESGLSGILAFRTTPVLETVLPQFAPIETAVMVDFDLPQLAPDFGNSDLVDWLSKQQFVKQLPPPQQALAGALLPQLSGRLLLAAWGSSRLAVLEVRDAVAARAAILAQLPQLKEIPLLNASVFEDVNNPQDTFTCAVVSRYVLAASQREPIQLALEVFRHRHSSVLDSSRFQRAELAAEAQRQVLFAWCNMYALRDEHKKLPPQLQGLEVLDNVTASLYRSPEGMRGCIELLPNGRSGHAFMTHLANLRTPALRTARYLAADTAWYVTVATDTWNTLVPIFRLPTARAPRPEMPPPLEVAWSRESWQDVLTKPLDALQPELVLARANPARMRELKLPEQPDLLRDEDFLITGQTDSVAHLADRWKRLGEADSLGSTRLPEAVQQLARRPFAIAEANLSSLVDALKGDDQLSGLVPLLSGYGHLWVAAVVDSDALRLHFSITRKDD